MSNGTDPPRRNRQDQAAANDALPILGASGAEAMAERAKARVAKGFRFVTVGSDARILAAGSQQLLGEMHQR